jgi:hypothetical protein
MDVTLVGMFMVGEQSVVLADVVAGVESVKGVWAVGALSQMTMG